MSSIESVMLLDTSVSSDNLGDEIIMESVRSELNKILPEYYLYTVPTHEAPGKRAKQISKSAKHIIAGGTNLISSRFFFRPNWVLKPWHLSFMTDVILMGVGWKGYRGTPDMIDRLTFRRLFSQSSTHSVRDSFTQKRLVDLGFKAVNTSCPTTWNLTPEHCSQIAPTRNRAAVTMLTYYFPMPDVDRAMLDAIAGRYDKVYFWPQQFEDLAYLRSLGNYDFEIISPNLPAYTAVLEHNNVDYIGSRLHGGIRALQLRRRALILAVDNRATEMGKDTKIPVIQRTEIERLIHWIENPAPVELELPEHAIQTWRSQFRPLQEH